MTDGARSASASSSYSTQLTGTRKLAVDSPPANRAVPEVGSVWFGPAA